MHVFLLDSRTLLPSKKYSYLARYAYLFARFQETPIAPKIFISYKIFISFARFQETLITKKIFISYKICISFCSILGDSQIFILYKICISFCSILGDSYRPKDVQILQDMHIFLLDSWSDSYRQKDFYVLNDMHIFLLDSRRLLSPKRHSYFTRYAYLFARFLKTPIAQKTFISYKICISFARFQETPIAHKTFISYKICISFCSILRESYRPKDIHILQNRHIFLLDSRRLLSTKRNSYQNMHIFLLDSRRLLSPRRYSYLTRFAYLFAQFQKTLFAQKIFKSYKTCISFCLILGDCYRPEGIHIVQDMHISLLDSRRLLSPKRHQHPTRYAYLFARFQETPISEKKFTFYKI